MWRRTLEDSSIATSRPPLNMLQHMLSYYKVIYKINLEGNTVKMMGPYYPSEPLTCLINQLKKGAGIFKIRRADDCQFNDGVERDHPFGANSYF